MATGDGGLRRLFAYGSLMVPAVWQAVCGVPALQRPATLTGYARFRVRGQHFPGIMPVTGATTEGVLIDDIDDTLWRRLDEFESTFYERLVVAVETPEAPVLAACAYVVAAAHRQGLTRERWTPERFTADHLDAYLARYA